MTIRKYWLILILGVAVLSISLNSLILSTLTDRYFQDYLEESYDRHLGQIINYSETVLESQDISLQVVSMNLAGHLTDPITGIKLYTAQGEILVEVDHKDTPSRMAHMMSQRGLEETKHYDILVAGEKVGVLSITSQAITANTLVARKFKSSLLVNSLIAFLLVSGILLVMGLYISKKMSLSLMETAKMTSQIQQGDDFTSKTTMIHEINAIRNGLKDLNSRLKLKSRSRKVLIDSMIHQSQTPLTIIQSHLEAIEDGVISLDVAHMKVLQAQVNNLNQVISNMGDAIETEREKEAPSLEDFSISAALKEIQSGLKKQFNLKDIGLDLECSGQDSVYTDKYRISQSVFNLLVNAYKYTQPGGRVSLKAISEPTSLMIRVEDTGQGIQEEDLDHIFKAYYRGQGSQDTRGDGLGLYIVKTNIEELGGQVAVKSILNEGSSFSLHVPITRN